MLSASHWLLAQARFCGCMHLPLSPNSTTPTVQVIFRYLQPDAPVFSIITVGMVTFHQSPCWYYPWADIILSTSWYTALVDMTFRWSHRSYQYICQQHPPYSYPQVMLIYYTCKNPIVRLVFCIVRPQAILSGYPQQWGSKCCLWALQNLHGFSAIDGLFWPWFARRSSSFCCKRESLARFYHVCYVSVHVLPIYIAGHEAFRTVLPRMSHVKIPEDFSL